MKTIIFDFDGTIADSFAIVISIAHDIIHRSRPVTAAEMATLRQTKLLEVAKKEQIPVWHIPFMLMRGRRVMSKRIDEVGLFEGMATVINQLHKDGYRLIIMSSNSSGNIKNFLEAHKLSRYFDKVYGGAGLFGKRRVLRRILWVNRLSADECIYIGDEARDIQASNEVGMSCIAVSWGYNSTILLRKLKPLAVVDNPGELLTVISHRASL